MIVDGEPSLDRQLVPDDVRRLLRRQVKTVTVVTAAADERLTGFTATSFTSVSMRPPMVSFCVDRESSAWPAMAVAGYAAVHFLGADQTELARTFATHGIDRFMSAAWRPGPYGVPLLEGAVAWLVGRIAERIPVGDHVIVLADPVAADYTDGAPLLYQDGRYAALTWPR